MRNHANEFAKRTRVVVVNVAAENFNRARVYIVKTADQLNERALARAGSADDSECFTSLYGEGNIRKRGLVCTGIGEGNVLENDGTMDFCKVAS